LIADAADQIIVAENGSATFYTELLLNRQDHDRDQPGLQERAFLNVAKAAAAR